MKKILIVDDQNDIRLLISLALRFEHYKIYEASNAQMALHLVTTIKPDLILLDILMPSSNNIIDTPKISHGLDLCRYLKKQTEYAQIPIIFLSICDSVDEIKMGMSAGASGYIVKPFQLENLLTLIAQQLLDKPCND